MSYDKKLSIGDRRSLMSITSNIPISGSRNLEMLIDGNYNNLFSFNDTSLNNSHYIKLNFNQMIKLLNLRLIGTAGKSRGVYDVYGSNDDNVYVLINENITLKDTYEYTYDTSINSSGYYKFYKFVAKSGIMASTGWLYELQFDYDINGYYLINKNNDYYNIDNSNYDIGNKEYKSLINTNGLTNLFIDNNLSIEELFVDKNINDETFKPINKFDNFRISKLVTI